MITYIQFVNEIPIGGEFPSINYYSSDKHAKTMQVEERGQWLIIHLGRTTEKGWEPNGQRRRVPMTNVVSLSEHGETAKAKGKADGGI